MIAAVSVAAAALQAVAYLLYLRCVCRREVRPNGTSWLMWAYGTALVVVLEADQGIALHLLALPIVCAVCSVLVAGVCLRRRAPVWSPSRADRAALMTDLALTAAYLGVLWGVERGAFADPGATVAKGLLLVCATGSTFVSFVPTIRTTRTSPEREDPASWAVWTAAYTLLLVGTLAQEGIGAAGLQFSLYPASCAALSAGVWWLAARPRLRSTPTMHLAWARTLERSSDRRASREAFTASMESRGAT